MNKFFAALLSAVLLLSLLVSCKANLVTLTYEDGQLVNKRAELAYTPAPLNYEPAAVGEEYAYYKKSDMTLYEIVGLDPREWLTEEYAGTATTIFYGSGITLPTLREMDPDKFYICISEMRTISLATVEDAEVIAALIDLYENGEQTEYPLAGSIGSYELKFHSERYPNLYYNLTFTVFPEGNFIYDRQSKRSVEIGELLDQWIGN